MRVWVWLGMAGACIVAVSKVAACGTTDCNDIGCTDGVETELKLRSFAWPDGEYRVELTLDDDQHVCTFTFPAARPRRDTRHSISCQPDAASAFELLIYQDHSYCIEGRSADSGTEPCAPAGERHGLQLTATGQPKQLRLRIKRDGEVVIQKDAKLTYTRFAPNAEACDPVCMASQPEISLD